MEPENELIAQRREKLEALRKKGIEPFGRAFETSGSIAEIREKFKEGEILRAAGRMTAHRDMGKSHFVDLRDATGRIQIYFHEKEIGAGAMEIFKLLDLGDFIGVEGTCFAKTTSPLGLATLWWSRCARSRPSFRSFFPRCSWAK